MHMLLPFRPNNNNKGSNRNCNRSRSSFCRSKHLGGISPLACGVIVVVVVASLAVLTLSPPSAMAVSALSSSAPSTPRKVAVIGGTGRLGRATVDALVRDGVPCRCLVRPQSKVPSEWTTGDAANLVTVIRGNLVEECAGVEGQQPPIIVPDAIVALLDGCTHCLALHGSTRKTKLSDWWPSSSLPAVEDTDVDHPKQVNYQSMKTLLQACLQQQPQRTCTHIVRITGKGEDPNGFFSVLINGFGSMAKGWNYEGEQVLRSNPDIDYTIIRPGIMKEKYPPPPPADDSNKPDVVVHLELEGNGGNNLKVSPVGYGQIADLVVECTKTDDHPQCKRVTLAAMNVPGTGTKTLSLSELVDGLTPDTREFPTTLIEQHKRAVRNAAVKAAGVFAVVGVALLAVVVRAVLSLLR